MTTIFLVLLIILAISTVFFLTAFFQSPNWLSRITVIDTTSVMTACAICLLAALHGNEHLLDAALLVAMIAFVGTTAVLHFMPLDERETE